MALAEVCLEIAARLEEDLVSSDPIEPKSYIKALARELRTAARASEGILQQQQQPVMVNPLMQGQLLSPQYQHILGIEEAKKQLRAEKAAKQGLATGIVLPNERAINLEDQWGGSTVEIADGPAFVEGTVTQIEIDPKMPIGAKTAISGGVYILKENRKLYFSQEETEKISQQQKVLRTGN